MYVVNPTQLKMKNLFECSGVVANWLIYKSHLPLFGKSEDGSKFYFVKTDKFTEAYEALPFYFKVGQIKIGGEHVEKTNIRG